MKNDSVLFFQVLLLLAFFEAQAQPQPVPLWEGEAPFIQSDSAHHQPVLFAYSAHDPSTPNPKPAVLICPGGGYSHLAMDHEGHQVAEWLNKLGIKAFVLRYRNNELGYRHPVPLADAQRALRLLRHNSSKWNLNPKQIGVLGFSAGGHLAATLSTQWELNTYEKTQEVDRVSARPDFTVLLYPVISFSNEAIAHKGSRWNLLGDNPSANLLNTLSPEQNIGRQTPPAFLAHAQSDPVVSVRNSLYYFSGLLEQEIPAEIHVFRKGGHGMGMRDYRPWKTWQNLFEAWLVSSEILSP